MYKLTLAMVKYTCLWFWLFLLACLILSGIASPNFSTIMYRCSDALAFCIQIRVGWKVRWFVFLAAVCCNFSVSNILGCVGADMESPLGGTHDFLLLKHEVTDDNKVTYSPVLSHSTRLRNQMCVCVCVCVCVCADNRQLRYASARTRAE